MNRQLCTSKEIVTAAKHCLKDIEVEGNLSEDWILNQLVHYFRTDGSKFLLDVIMDLSLRYEKEFIDNNRSILAKCLVGDGNIAQPMILWVIDIEFKDKQTLLVKLSDYYYLITLVFKAKELDEDDLFIKMVEKNHFTVGMKLKVQNIQHAKVPLDDLNHYLNPVVHAQNHELFKVGSN